jgi:hypothetical protein
MVRNWNAGHFFLSLSVYYSLRFLSWLILGWHATGMPATFSSLCLCLSLSLSLFAYCNDAYLDGAELDPGHFFGRAAWVRVLPQQMVDNVDA